MLADSRGPSDKPGHGKLVGKRVWVAGHNGMVGSALRRRLAREDCVLVTVERDEVDLRRQGEVEAWIRRARPDIVLIAAATVGGIHANRSRPAEFIYDNLAIGLNVLQAAREVAVEKLLFLGSSCIYPKFCQQPMSEDMLLTGPLEPTNEWYAMAKLAGLTAARAYRLQWGLDYITALPASLYGPGDNFDLENSHVIPALLRKFHEARMKGEKVVEIWGTGKPRREFLHVDDLAEALIHLVEHYSDEGPINVGSGEDISIAELASLVARVVGYEGQLVYNTAMPDGTPRKLLDVTRMSGLGWKPKISLEVGLRDAYASYLARPPAAMATGFVPKLRRHAG